MAEDKEWSIGNYGELSKIKTFAENDVPYNDPRYYDTCLKKRKSGLSRLGYTKSGKVTEKGFAFVRHCLQRYTAFGSKLALAHDTNPDSYPDVGDYFGDAYYNDLGYANERIRDDFEETEPFFTDEEKLFGPRIQAQLDVSMRFCRRDHRGNYRPHWNAYGGNGWDASYQYLVSNYDEDHFWNILEHYEEYDYVSQAEAFADLWYELWGMYLYSKHYHECTSGSALMDAWRWELGYAVESQAEELLEKTGILKALGGSPDLHLPPEMYLSAEYAQSSDENLERVVKHVQNLEKIKGALHDEVADIVRKRGVLVIGGNGEYQVAVENGAKLLAQPFIDAVHEIMLSTHSAANECSVAQVLRGRMETLDKSPKEEWASCLYAPLGDQEGAC